MLPPNSSSKTPSFAVYLGTVLFFGYILLSLVFVAPLVILCMIFPFEIRYEISRYWCYSVSLVLRYCCGIRYEIEGLEHLPQNRAVVVLSKHQAAWETLALRHLLPRQTVLAKRSLLQIPLGGWAFATLRPITIDRSNQTQALRMLLDQGTAALQAGLWVVIFPEGTRTAPGETRKFNAGGAMLACKTNAPVIPIAHNAGEVWPHGFLKYPGTIKVKIGELIETEGKKPKEINAQVEEWMIQAMAEISTV